MDLGEMIDRNIRHIDDLGRVVIPKVIRNQVHITEGDALQVIANNDGTITLRKVMGE
jgi:AbrB family looped-hinge helix DNA binding protein